LSGLILDTCVCLWLVEGADIGAGAQAAVLHASRDGDLWVSPFSAWEVALLLKKDRIDLSLGADDWYRRLLSLWGVREAKLTPEILIDSVNLPGRIHGDPADRIMIATARQLDATLVTRDATIEAYAALGHVRVLPC
jgi:PIN domain nuclease of toxin-antitoxin system